MMGFANYIHIYKWICQIILKCDEIKHY